MLVDIATYPLRIGVRTAGRLVDAIGTGFNLARYVAEALLPSDAVPAPTRPERSRPRVRPRTAAAAPPRPEPAAAPEPEPIHVSEEPVVVAEVADEEAAGGVGAQITIAEPWEGYRRMKAADVIDRLQAATPEELAVVQLYENQGRARKTVLAAVEERLRYSQRK